jgi:hypothetical protein
MKKNIIKILLGISIILGLLIAFSYVRCGDPIEAHYQAEHSLFSDVPRVGNNNKINNSFSKWFSGVIFCILNDSATEYYQRSSLDSK